MNMRFLLGALLLFLSLPALAIFDVSQLMADLARQKGGKARFVEKRFIAVLEKPVVSSGEIVYAGPNRLEKRTLLPKPERMVLEGDTLLLERDKKTLSISLSGQPEAQAFIDSIRDTLAGNRLALERNYGLHLTGSSEKWVLTLLPSDQKIAALVLRITVSGTHNQIRSIEYLLADGDRSLMTFEPLELP